MIPIGTEDIERRFARMTRGGLIASLILTLIGVVPMFLMQYLPFAAYAIIAAFLPTGLYYFTGNAFPMVTDGVRNDGAVLLGFKRQDDVSKVTAAILKIHAGLYGGKSPAEIEESLYFDVPQLPEDDFNFAIISDLRYNYYLDKGDKENALKTGARIEGLYEYLPDGTKKVFKADRLFDACALSLDEDKADELMYELDKYLNGDNTVTNIRIKLAYLIYVVNEIDNAESLFALAEKELKYMPVAGIRKKEEKLLSTLRDDYRKKFDV